MSTSIRFSTGRTMLTSGVNDLVAENTEFAKLVLRSMARHATGDWGDLGQDDKNTNNAALLSGERILSSYEQPGLPKIWIVTESDRSATTVLFPEEY